LVWLDRAGSPTGTLPLPPGRYEDIRIGPDGRRAIIVKRSAPEERELWLVDLEAATASRVGTPSVTLGSVAWSPDAKAIVYGAIRSGSHAIYTRLLDPPSEEHLLFQSDALFKNPFSWSPDGRYVLFEQPSSATGWDAWCVPVAKEGKPFPLVHAAANEGGGWISPDGKWVAYGSDESGRFEYYLQSFPTPGARRQLTTTGSGTWASPCGFDWSKDGRSALVVDFDGMVREIEFVGDDLRVGATRLLFRSPPGWIAVCPHPDHRRFLASIAVDAAVPAAARLMVNWPSAMEKP